MPIYTSKMLSGCYDIPYIKVDINAYYTNQTPTDAYRGAGRPEAIYLLERVMDMVAERCNKSPIAVRSLNFIKKDEFPKRVVTGLTYDNGDYKDSLIRVLNNGSYSYWRDEQKNRRKNNSSLQIGIGLSSYVEFCGTGPSKEHKSIGLMTSGYESGVVRFHPTGEVSVISGSTPAGQGHETTWSKIVENEFSISQNSIVVKTGETINNPWGGGTYGSRSAAVGGTAVYKACQKIKDKCFTYLSNIWGGRATDIIFEHGIFYKDEYIMSIQEIAKRLNLAHDLPDNMDPGLEATVFFEPTNFTYPYGTHLCIVEINTNTGIPRIVEYSALDDCGHILHQQIVEGQIFGGIVQGIGQALYEEVNQIPLIEPSFSTSFRNYQIPNALDIPKIKLFHTETPTPVNPLGVKGVGEAGTIASPPAIINAIVDALSIFGVSNIDMPATPDKIWNLINRGGID